MNPKKYNKIIEDSNLQSIKVAVNIRLYSTDEIFLLYSNLSKYNQFTFSSKRLFEESKTEYIKGCNLLAKKMQEDLNRY